ncbi:MAG: hypothetical protein IJE59_04485 [Clostridia bacterium]|nr:hypothetical protein [Clostridia bacterium]
MLKTAQHIVVENGKCPIDKMVEIQNKEGLSPTVVISRECYRKLLETANNNKIKIGYCELKLFWDATSEYSETTLTLTGPCFYSISKSKEPAFKVYYVVKDVMADDIQYTKGEDLSETAQYFLLEGEE